MDYLPLNEGLEALAPEAGGACGLAERTDLQKVTERKALYTDIDYNGHVNNVSYIKWIEDILDSQLMEKAQKIRLDINYLSETLSREVTEIFYAPIKDDNASYAFAFEGKKTETSQVTFRAELRLWE
jgi:acyl-ACP thioesterase